MLSVEGYRVSFIKAEKNIPHLYNEGFSDIKAIIAENGAGKISLVYYIGFVANRYLDHMRYPKAICNNITILENRDDSGRVNFRVYARKKWKLELQDISLGILVPDSSQSVLKSYAGRTCLTLTSPLFTIPTSTIDTASGKISAPTF